MIYSSIVITIVALYGTWLNANQKRACFYWWIASNSGWAIYNLMIGQYALAGLFAVYLILAIKGLMTWK